MKNLELLNKIKALHLEKIQILDEMIICGPDNVKLAPLKARLKSIALEIASLKARDELISIDKAIDSASPKNPQPEYLTLTKFISERIAYDSNSWVSKADAYESYLAFCKENKYLYPLKLQTFCKIFFKQCDSCFGADRRIDHIRATQYTFTSKKRVYAFKNLTLKTLQ